jgi:Na+/melibiose symporter-like transporter
MNRTAPIGFTGRPSPTSTLSRGELENLPLENDNVRRKGKQPARHDGGIVMRMVIIVVLTVTLVGVIRWSMNVTNANARQISNNLTRMRDHIDAVEASEGQKGSHASPGIGPSIDPVAPRRR